MINKIKCYRVDCNRDTLGNKQYLKKDITNQLEMPIADSAQRDGVLDTSRISLLNRSKTPLKPLSRIIIELYDSLDGGELSEKIYRVVDVDQVTNVVRGPNAVYRHSVALLEPTKILERRDVPNLTFTNYLYLTGTTDDFIEEATRVYYSAEGGDDDLRYISLGYLPFVEDEDCARLTGPYRFVGDKVPLNFKLNVRVIYDAAGPDNYYNTKVSQFYVVTPNDETIMLYQVKDNGDVSIPLDIREFSLDLEGVYKFVQIYYTVDSAGEPRGLLQIYSQWTILVVSEIPREVQPRTIWDVANRVVKCQKLLKKGENPEFQIDLNQMERLLAIKAPEFVVNEGTLFDALCQIGNYIHAIPRLIPYVVAEDDYSNWNCIAFDFLNDGKELDGINYALIDLEHSSEDYASNLVSNVKNATITNYSGLSSNVEPAKNAYLSTRTESDVFEVSNDNAIFRTKDRIRKIVKAVVLHKGRKIDISERIVEESVYKQKTSYKTSVRNAAFMKAYYLYYKEGEKNIYGLNHSYTTKETDTFAKFQAIINIIALLSIEDAKSIDIKDIAINIEYVSYSDFKVRVYKECLSDIIEDSTLYYNQQANVVDVDDLGENIFHALRDTGNIKLAKTTYYNHVKNIPGCGDFFVDKDGDKWVAFQINREIMYGDPIKTSILFAKNFNELFSDIAIKKAIRQFEISEECYDRRLDIQYFCVVGTKLEYDELDVEKLKGGFCNDYNIAALVNHFNNKGRGKLATVALCRSKHKDELGDEGTNAFLCPVSGYSFGRSVLISLEMDTNYSAGTYIDTALTGTKKTKVQGEDIQIPDGSYAIENYIPYCNNAGKTDTFSFSILSHIKEISSLSKAQEYAFKLNKLDDISEIVADADNAILKLEENEFNVDKDSRERLCFSLQLTFIAQNRDIDVYKDFVSSMPYVTETNTKYNFVVFESHQGKVSGMAQGTYYVVGQVVAAKANDATVRLYCFDPSKYSGEGFGIVTEEGKLCVYVDKKVQADSYLSPIYLMFRPSV